MPEMPAEGEDDGEDAAAFASVANTEGGAPAEEAPKAEASTEEAAPEAKDGEEDTQSSGS